MKHIFTILITAVIILTASASCEKFEYKHLDVGDKMPVFSVKTIDGKAISSGDLAGKKTLIVHFTTTCGDCKTQLPEIKVFYDLWYAADNVNVLCIARDEDETVVNTFWKENKFDMPAAAPGDRSIFNLFDCGSGSGVPQIYGIDEKGNIIFFFDDSRPVNYEELSEAFGLDVNDMIITITPSPAE